MFIILPVFLFLLLPCCYFWEQQDYLAPSFLIIFTFFISTLECAFYLPKWQTNISSETVLLILMSLISFVAVTLFIKYCYVSTKKYTTKIYLNNELDNNSDSDEPIKVNKIILIFFALLQIAIFLLSAKEIVQLTSKYGTDGSLASAIAMYQYLGKFTTLNLSLPSYLAFGLIFITAIGMIWGYIIAYNICFFKKLNFLITLNFALSCIASMLTGSRGYALQMIVSALFIFLILQHKKNGTVVGSFKSVLKVVLILVILLLSFEGIAGILGRDNSLSLPDYISIYLGAPIKNLDIFLLRDTAQSTVWGGETFLQQINWMLNNMGKNPLTAINDPMNYSAGYNLGNVSTALKPYYHDFGFIGTIALMSLMALIMQIFYESIKCDRNIIKPQVSLKLITYTQLLFDVAFTFFSNKFYENFNITFFERMVFIIIFVKIMQGRRIKVRL